MIVYRSIRFKQDFLTVDLGEELCYYSHNGNGKIRKSPCQRFDRVGLKEWKSERGYLRDTCLAAQDKFKLYLDYFKVKY